MGKPYSMDLRERVVAAIEGEHRHEAAARVFERHCNRRRLV
jgi:hypothetical protein